MRTLSALVWLLLVMVLPAQTVWSQDSSAQQAASASTTQASQAAPPAESNIDPAKEADIRRLLDVVGVKTLAMQMMDEMMGTMKPMLSNSLPLGNYRNKLVDLFLAKFRSKMDPQHLVDMAVPIYDKHLSHEEIKGLIDFYQTPLGKKTITELPAIMSEMQAKDRECGARLDARGSGRASRPGGATGVSGKSLSLAWINQTSGGG